MKDFYDDDLEVMISSIQRNITVCAFLSHFKSAVDLVDYLFSLSSALVNLYNGLFSLESRDY